MKTGELTCVACKGGGKTIGSGGHPTREPCEDCAGSGVKESYRQYCERTFGKYIPPAELIEALADAEAGNPSTLDDEAAF